MEYLMEFFEDLDEMVYISDMEICALPAAEYTASPTRCTM